MGCCCGKPKPKAQQPAMKKEEPKPIRAEVPKPVKNEEPKPEYQKVTTKKEPPKESAKKKGAAENKEVKLKEEDEFTDLQKLLKEHGIDDNAKINSKYTMFFDPNSNGKGVSNFMKFAKGKKLDKMKKFSMIYSKELDKEGCSNMADFINNSQLSHLDYLYLHGGDKAKLSSLDKSALKNLMRVSVNQVYIDTFTLDEADVKLIFENCFKAKELLWYE